jgi:hypothetical protein
MVEEASREIRIKIINFIMFAKYTNNSLIIASQGRSKRKTHGFAIVNIEYIVCYINYLTFLAKTAYSAFAFDSESLSRDLRVRNSFCLM